MGGGVGLLHHDTAHKVGQSAEEGLSLIAVPVSPKLSLERGCHSCLSSSRCLGP